MRALTVGIVKDAAAQWGGSQYDLTIEWELSTADKLQQGQTIEGVINGLRVTLSSMVPAPSSAARSR